MSALLTLQGLTVSFHTDAGRFKAADRVSFDIRPGEMLGLVGESGCGKTVTAQSLIRLLPMPPASIDSGSALFKGRDLLRLPIDEMRRIRGREISMIFQDPMTALSPLRRIGDQLAETLLLHQPLGRKNAWRIGEILPRSAFRTARTHARMALQCQGQRRAS